MERLKTILKMIKDDVDFEHSKNLVNDGILDSLDIVSIISSVKITFGINLRPADIDPDNFQSIDDMWKMIQKNINS